jgi:predicted nucleic acid-binding protein
MIIAIDTSVLIGILDTRDVWHSAALQVQGALLPAQLAPVYFDCVLAEAASTLVRRLREQRREQEIPVLLDRLEAELPPETTTWLFPDVPRLYRHIMALIRSSAGELNFNDGLIALACRERHIRLLASFDRDFDRIPWLIRIATPADVVTAQERAALPTLEKDIPESTENP